tara:strand:- start:104 stop:400 length:297 start_codon:yes stop_codon:yes gene_type:complete
MNEHQSIKNTLDVIRKALEDDDDNKIDNNDDNDNILILNRLVKKDGTIDIVDDVNINKNEVREILESKIDQLLEKNLSKWLDKKLPFYIEKYFKNKNI